MEVKGRILVYTVVGCPSCMEAKSLLQDRGLSYADVNLDAYPHLRLSVKDRTGQTSVPQIFFNSIHVGGLKDLQTLVCSRLLL